jgi:hypothetical protein
MSITYSEYVFEALGIQHVTRMRHIVNRGLSHSTVFTHAILRKEKFLGKTLLDIKNFCLDFLYKFSLEYF